MKKEKTKRILVKLCPKCEINKIPEDEKECPKCRSNEIIKKSNRLRVF